jgi:hypothetical protein
VTGFERRIRTLVWVCGQEWNLLLLRSFSHDTGIGLTGILTLASSLLAVGIVLLSDLRSPASALRRVRIKPLATLPTDTVWDWLGDEE